MLAHLAAIASVAVMVSSCVLEGQQIRHEFSSPTAHSSISKASAPVKPWQSTAPLGREVLFPAGVAKSRALLRSWIASTKANGTNTLLLKQPLPRKRGRSDIRWKEFVQDAHRQRVRVYAVVNLREELFDEHVTGWNDIRLTADSDTLTPSNYPDLFDLEYQAAIVSQCLALTAAGVDLIIFRFDPHSGPFDGFSQRGLEGFRRDFDRHISPSKLFTSISPEWTQPARGVISMAQARRDFAPEFWRWVGWKNREYLNVLEAVMNSVRRQRAGAKFGIELHADTMINPRRALVRYTEDFLETRQHSFDRFIVTASWSGPYREDRSSIGNSAIRMTELLDDPSKVFVLLSSRRPMWSTAEEAHAIKVSLGLQQGVGLGFRKAFKNNS